MQVCSCQSFYQNSSVVLHPLLDIYVALKAPAEQSWAWNPSWLSPPHPSPLGTRRTQGTAIAPGPWHLLLPLPRMPFPLAYPVNSYLPFNPQHNKVYMHPLKPPPILFYCRLSRNVTVPITYLCVTTLQLPLMVTTTNIQFTFTERLIHARLCSEHYTCIISFVWSTFWAGIIS